MAALHKAILPINKIGIKEIPLSLRINIAKACFDFIEHRTNLDLMGWDDLDIFRH